MKLNEKKKAGSNGHIMNIQSIVAPIIMLTHYGVQLRRYRHSLSVHSHMK